jgi:hypothetical protein
MLRRRPFHRRTWAERSFNELTGEFGLASGFFGKVSPEFEGRCKSLRDAV